MSKVCFMRVYVMCSILIMYGDLEAYKQSLPFYRAHSGRIFENKGALQILHHLGKNIWADARRKLLALSAKVYENFLWDNPYNGVPAFVRLTALDEICDSERLTIQRRTDRALQGFYALLPAREIHKVPRIALCCSGGGFRAMLATGGFLAGLDDIGVLDCVTYMAGVSGSTWLMGPWIASGRSIQEYMRYVTQGLKNGLAYQCTTDQARIIVKQLLVKLLYNQPISSIDIYGPLLANTLLQDSLNCLKATITDTHQAAIRGEYPFPIYTAIATNQQPYEWFEVSPLEIGSSYTRAYIPTWAYGRHFYDGISRDCAPEQTLGYYMGVCGSAFEVDVADLLAITANKVEQALQAMPIAIADVLQEALHRFADHYLQSFRLFPSLLPNSTYRMNAHTAWRDYEHLALVDAGIDGNLPFAPLLRSSRAIDLIIVLDSSQTIIGAPELQRAQAYAQRHNLPLPKIDCKGIHESSDAYVFWQSELSSCPSVLYIPLARNVRYSKIFDPAFCTAYAHCNTFNFTYTAAQAEELAGLARFIIREHAETIIGEITRLSSS